MTAKICLITGASSGIGHATALGLVRAGHTVYGAARRLAQAMAERAESSTGGSDPAVVATAIRKAVESAHPRPRHPVGRLARTVLWLNRLLPDRAFDKLVTKR